MFPRLVKRVSYYSAEVIGGFVLVLLNCEGELGGDSFVVVFC